MMPIFICALIAICLTALIFISTDNAALMEDCMKDHKKYECVSIMRGQSSAIIPIVIKR